MELRVSVINQDALGARGYFFAGGSYSGEAGKTHMHGQMFVEVYVPKQITQPYPLIFLHGAGQTNLNWLGTPDGRPSWLDYFVEQGYICYLAEQPARGRSAYHPEDDGKIMYHPAEVLQNRFTSAEGKWPQAALHTQWPEEGQAIGTKVFDQFAASQVEYLASNKASQERVLAAAGDLLEKTGPAILITHSQAGPFGWLIADRFPEQIKGIIAVEPNGPPFGMRLTEPVAQNYGLADLPLCFSPAVTSPADFPIALCTEHRPDEIDGWILNSDAYRLPTLAGIPIAILIGEASYHAQYDYLMSDLLTKLGVKHDYIPLATVGIHGNSHMMMLEKNNLDIAAFISGWITENIEA